MPKRAVRRMPATRIDLGCSRTSKCVAFEHQWGVVMRHAMGGVHYVLDAYEPQTSLPGFVCHRFRARGIDLAVAVCCYERPGETREQLRSSVWAIRPVLNSTRA